MGRAPGLVADVSRQWLRGGITPDGVVEPDRPPTEPAGRCQCDSSGCHRGWRDDTHATWPAHAHTSTLPSGTARRGDAAVSTTPLLSCGCADFQATGTSAPLSLWPLPADLDAQPEWFVGLFRALSRPGAGGLRDPSCTLAIDLCPSGEPAAHPVCPGGALGGCPWAATAGSRSWGVRSWCSAGPASVSVVRR